MAKIVFGLDGDESLPVVAVTTPGGNIAAQVGMLVEVGQKYYVFANIPFNYSNGIVVNFAQAATYTGNAETDIANIMAQLESPPLSMISEP